MTKNCSRCKGKGFLKGVSYAGGVCAKCGGRGVVEIEVAETKAAREFIIWATEEGARREGGARAGFAAHAARHLASTAPDRFAKAVAHRRAGRGEAVYAALVALADEAVAG